MFVQKPYLRIIYLEKNIEKVIDMKNQFRIKHLKDPLGIREPASKKILIIHSKTIKILMM